LEAVNKFSKYYYKSFKINITNYPTLPSLSLAVFGNSFYDEDNKIKMIKGPIGEFIREAYFGGNVDVFVEGKEKFVSKGYHYDINSQYPNAMLKKMPKGNPIFSNNTELNYYFGFVFAKITPPSADILNNIFIQRRDKRGKITCPRVEFYRWIFTEELKQAIKFGYKAQILCGINFPKQCNEKELFGAFVNHFYEIKRNAKNAVERTIAKLMLNSLYGKFGQKDIESVMKVVSKKESEIIRRTHHYTIFAEINEDKFIIKFAGKLNSKLRKLYDEQEEEIQKLTGFTKIRGVLSAVHISCIISAYARMSINPFKNIKDNMVIYSDTDSIIVRKSLEKKFIGGDIGL
jgi:hypothetical protein